MLQHRFLKETELRNDVDKAQQELPQAQKELDKAEYIDKDFSI